MSRCIVSALGEKARSSHARGPRGGRHGVLSGRASFVLVPGGGCATAASCRCLAGRSDRRRPPLCPWDRGDGGRPQRVSSEARPARPSHNFRPPAAETSSAPGILGRNRCRSAGQRATAIAARLASDDQKAARPSGAVVAFTAILVLLRDHRASGGAKSLVRTPGNLKAVDHGLQTPSFAAKDAEKHRYLAQ